MEPFGDLSFTPRSLETWMKFIISQVTGRKNFSPVFHLCKYVAGVQRFFYWPACQGFPSFMNFRVNLYWASLYQSFYQFRQTKPQLPFRFTRLNVPFKTNDFFSSKRRAISAAIAPPYENARRFNETTVPISVLFLESFLVRNYRTKGDFLRCYVNEVCTKLLIS